MKHSVKRTLIPASIDNFSELVSYKNDEGQGYLFVDKSLLIKEFYSKGSKVTLITRPRRFGKTLNLSMLQHFFAPEVSGVKTKGLFDALEISRYPEVMKRQGQSPAIFLSLKGIRGESWKEMERMIKACLQKLYSQYAYLPGSVRISESHKSNFKRVLEKEGRYEEDREALRLLSDMLFQHTGKQVYIFLDEYDTPMHDAYVHGYYEACREFMASFLGSALKGNDALAKGMITGILKVSQAGLFSRLNNLTIDTVLYPDGGYGSYFGFLEEEADTLLDAAQLPKRAHELKEMYNGYQIGEFTLYNPFSIVSFINAAIKLGGKDMEQALRPYWINTDGRDLVRLLATSNLSSLSHEFALLIKGKTIKTEVNFDIVLSEDMRRSPVAFWSLLLLAGYLKKVGVEKNEDEIDLYELAFPNQEVLKSLREILLGLLAGPRQQISGFTEPLRALARGEVEMFSEFLRRYMRDTPSFFDTGGDFPEQFYHGLLLGMTIVLRDTYLVTSNRESGSGRYDICLSPVDKQRKGVILELKAGKAGEALKELAKDALQQILDKDYARQLRSEGVKEILAVGVAFRGKEVEVVWEAAWRPHPKGCY